MCLAWCMGISMGTNCTPLLADLFLHVYQADFLQRLLKNKVRKLFYTINCHGAIVDSVIISIAYIQISYE